MLPRLLANTANAPRVRLFWAIVGILAAAQLAALWMLCNDQVQQGQMRRAMIEVERVALADCLRHVPGATLDSCTDKAPSPDAVPNSLLVAHSKPRDRSGLNLRPMSSVVPVKFVMR